MTEKPFTPKGTAEAHERLSRLVVPDYIGKVNNILIEKFENDDCIVNIHVADFGNTAMTRSLVKKAFQDAGWTVTESGSELNGKFYQLRRTTT